MNCCGNINCKCRDGQIGLQGLKGPKGDTGAQGVQGIQGPTGAQGVQGEKGETGDKGATGIMGDPGIAGITGPAGATGQTGPTGPQGATGSAGANGTNGTPGSDALDALTWTIVDPTLSAVNVQTAPNYAYVFANDMFTTPTVWLPSAPYTAAPSLGDEVLLIGTSDSLGAREISLRPGEQVEMSEGTNLYVTTTAVQFGSLNSGDCLRLSYRGSGKWVITEAVFANGQVPLFI